MHFTYSRTIHFQDTDAAGVVYFANVLSICHEAYEASLAASGIDLKQFFRITETAVPIIHASVDFYRPLFCGDRILVQLMPQQQGEDEFQVAYEIFLAEASDRSAAKAMTRHVCIDPATRSRKPLSKELVQWLLPF